MLSKARSCAVIGLEGALVEVEVDIANGLAAFSIVGLPDTSTAALLGSILLFRCIYYLTPLGFAAVLLVAHEATQQRERFAWIGNIAADWLAEFTPQVLGVLIIVGGIVLLFSGAVPPRLRARAPRHLVLVHDRHGPHRQ